MDERRCEERVDEILRRRWLKDVVRVDFDVRAAPPRFRTDPRTLEQARRREFGKRIVFTDRHQGSDDQIVAAYRSRSDAEGAFRQMKAREFAAFSPAFHWTDQKLRVQAFHCALLLVNKIERAVRRAGVELGPKIAMPVLAGIHETTPSSFRCHPLVARFPHTSAGSRPLPEEARKVALGGGLSGRRGMVTTDEPASSRRPDAARMNHLCAGKDLTLERLEAELPSPRAAQAALLGSPPGCRAPPSPWTMGFAVAHGGGSTRRSHASRQ